MSVDGDFQRTMIAALGALQQQTVNLKWRVDSLQLTLKEHTDLLRCVDTQCTHGATLHESCNWPCPNQYACSNQRRFLTKKPSPNDRNAYCAACRNHSSSMMSVSEVQADFVLNNRRAQYAEGGDCQLAACEAAAFFDTTHRLMSPKIVQGVLYAGSVIQPVMGRTGRSPDARMLITPTMKRYVLDGCMWRAANDTDSHGVINVRGCSHFVTRVMTLDGQRVFVDWGIGQFSSLPEGASLFVKMEHALDD